MYSDRKRGPAARLADRRQEDTTMGLFSKKVCDICGGDIGLLGNRKLSDGNLCKDCAKKLSPWMTDRRQSTVEEIRQHLAYREQNKRMLALIHPTVVMGSNVKVYIDEAAGKFFVTSHTNWRDRNPDVIDLSQVIDVSTEVTEHRTEEYHRDRDGKNVPFNPPRYRMSYEFETTLLIDSPFFSEIRFELTETRPEHRVGEEYRYYEQMADALRAALMPANGARTAAQPNLADALSAAIGQAVASINTATAGVQSVVGQKPASDQWTCACGAVNNGNFCTQCGAKRPEPVKTFRCDKCGWTPEDPTHPPKFCPNCGDPFNANDAL